MAGNGEAGDDPTDPRSELQDRQAQYKVSPELMRTFDDKGKRKPRPRPVVIELNLDFVDGAAGAKQEVVRLLEEIGARPTTDLESRYHVFAELTKRQIQELARRDGEDGVPAIYKIWPDRELKAFLDRSIRTIKADACTRTFGSDGLGIVWAVIDSGIDGDHPHFATYSTLNLTPTAPHQMRGALVAGLDHQDFTGGKNPLSDLYGHGTHVAGIIAGATPFIETDGVRSAKPPGAVRAYSRRDENDNVRTRVAELEQLVTGVAPRCKLMSLKVLNDGGKGEERSLLAALDYVARINEDGRLIRVHGVNISIGYPFDAQWFAAGQSAICVAVNRLVRTGVVVVVAAGNEGSVLMQMEDNRGVRRIGLDQSISDPGNAEFAITVGSTHGDAPHTYGVSYFSSRGPTIDGRPKPDLVAPGERILSCASREKVEKLKGEANLEDSGGLLQKAGATFYRDETGTSMAAPHVSGAAAALLSVRREFIGQPERVKEIFVSSATDLKRKRDFQGAGLLDLMRAIQSV